MTSRIWGIHSSDSGPEDMMQVFDQKEDETYHPTQFFYKGRKVVPRAEDHHLFKRVALQQQRLVAIVMNVNTMYHNMEVQCVHHPINYLN